MTVIEVKENGAIRTKMLSCNSPFLQDVEHLRKWGSISFVVKC
jgi:hypothetical protein